ncbi:hypothetical protein [Kitasatospora indigofera]|uniref:hypothetical protein n=1 Tax=Kitasatospora indigofera TaxID=67307 RepID=UPI00339FD976
MSQVLSEVVAENDQVADLVIDLGGLLAAFLGEGSALPVGRVTSLRISPSRTSIRQPMGGWPDHLVAQADGGSVHMVGGTDMNGDHPVPIDYALVDEVVRQADAAQSDSFAVVAVGALMDEEIELLVADHLVRRSGRPVVLSHQIGGLRFIEREASTILNAALLAPSNVLFDRLQLLVQDIAPRSHQSFLLADGSRLGREETRAFPIRALGTRAASLAQGAAAFCGVRDAIVLVWTPQQTELLTIEQGCLRTEPLRQLPALLPGVHLSQRYASRVALPRDVLSEAIVPDLVRADLALVLVPAMFDWEPTSWDEEVSAAFEEFAAELAQRFPALHVVREVSWELAALGAAAAHPQSEVVKFAVVEGAEGRDSARQRTRTMAQSRVLATDARVRPRTVTDTLSPLSFLESGPVLIRVHVDGTDKEAP